MKQTLESPQGLQKQIKTSGISWTVLFFSWVALLIRGQYKAALIIFILKFIVVSLAVTTFSIIGITYVFISVYLCLKANELRYKQLISEDWKVVN